MPLPEPLPHPGEGSNMLFGCFCGSIFGFIFNDVNVLFLSLPYFIFFLIFSLFVFFFLNLFLLFWSCYISFPSPGWGRGWGGAYLQYPLVFFHHLTVKQVDYAVRHLRVVQRVSHHDDCGALGIELS